MKFDVISYKTVEHGSFLLQVCEHCNTSGGHDDECYEHQLNEFRRQLEVLHSALSEWRCSTEVPDGKGQIDADKALRVEVDNVFGERGW